MTRFDRGNRSSTASTDCRAVNINDKHIEVIVRQMMRGVKIEDVGDTELRIPAIVIAPSGHGDRRFWAS